MSQKPLTIGGQAVIEGVMIRAPSCVTVAVRRPDGTIATRREAFTSLAQRVKIFSLPIIRGVVNVLEMMVVGMRALDFSAQEALEEKTKDKTEKPKNRVFAGVTFITSLVISLVIAIFMFKFVPLFITERLRILIPLLARSVLLFNLTDGVLRIGIFFLYIFILSRIKTFQRIFEYHGAEHKAIFAYEKGHELTIENTKKESPRHPRCGTSFIILVLVISILLLSLVPHHPVFLINFLRRLSILPLIAGMAYELLKFTAKYHASPVMKFLTYPGILTQYITTKEPDTAQLEVAIAAVEKAVTPPKLSDLSSPH